MSVSVAKSETRCFRLERRQGWQGAVIARRTRIIKRTEASVLFIIRVDELLSGASYRTTSSIGWPFVSSPRTMTFKAARSNTPANMRKTD